MTYDDLAEKLGVSRQCAYNYLNGRKNNDVNAGNGSKVMRVDTLLKVCEAVGLQLVVTSK